MDLTRANTITVSDFFGIDPNEGADDVDESLDVRSHFQAAVHTRPEAQDAVPTMPQAAVPSMPESQAQAAVPSMSESQAASNVHDLSQAAVPTMPPTMPQAAVPSMPESQAASNVHDLSQAAVPTMPESQAAVPTMPQAAVPSMPESQAASTVHDQSQAAVPTMPESQAAVPTMPQAAVPSMPVAEPVAEPTMPESQAAVPTMPQAAVPTMPESQAAVPTMPQAAVPSTARAVLTPGGALTDIGLFPEMTLHCQTCGSRCQLSRMRCRGKSCASWECLNCGTKSTQLRRVFGKWPIGEFVEMEPDEQKAFFSDIGGMSMEALKQHCERTFSKTESHGKFYEERGQFLPLSVWAARGFPVEDIEAKSHASDRRFHDVLGMTYRVALMSSGSKGWKGSSSTDALNKRSKAAALTDDHEPDAAAAAAVAAAADDADTDASVESETDSSSSSSSSSASKKKSKKKKSKKSKGSKKSKKKKSTKKSKKLAKKEAKAKAAAAASEKAEAAAKKKNDKEQVVAKKLCDAVVTKCEGVSLTLAATLADPGTALLPEAVLQSCKRSLEVVEGLVKRAKLIIAQEMPAADLGVSKSQAVFIISNPILSYLPFLIQELVQKKRSIENRKLAMQNLTLKIQNGKRMMKTENVRSKT
jgi:hypothetical protein